jgi:DNA-binding cell septation regulator SpoVG
VTPSIRLRSWVPASAEDVVSGLLGFVSVEFGHLVIDGIVVRRTADGRFVLSFPMRKDRAGRKHAIVRPIDDDARQAMERQIIKALGANLSEVMP